MRSIEAHRAFYAKLIVAKAGSSNEALIAAFSSVPRERFVGPGPWNVHTPTGYITTAIDDPTIIYQDILIALAVDREINNGQPSLHARALDALEPAAGETVVHIGVATGYYSAILAELVGGAGSVHAYEIERDLAQSAGENLRPWPNVHVVFNSASEGKLPTADVIYANAGATHPPESWLDALSVGGRLMFPLTTEEGAGHMLLVTRVATERYSARFIMPVQFYLCAGATEVTASLAVKSAFENGKNPREVKSLWRNTEPDDTAWCVGTGWWLSTAPHT
jgi:protein-L-isoaspartate(D-aspartate) O-methyltransferase